MTNKLSNDYKKNLTKELYDGIIPIIEADEYEETQDKADAGDPMACLQIIHYAIFKSNEPSWFSVCIKYMSINKDKLNDYSKVLEKLGSAAGAKMVKDINRKKTADKDEKFNNDPHYTLDGKKPNAVLITTDGRASLIIIESFDDGKYLGAPLECNRVDRVMNRLTEWAKNKFGITMVGYVDANGIMKGLKENDAIQSISGYDYIAGDCVIVGMDEKYNYIPLHAFDAVSVWKYFNNKIN